jgi:hypothetical protein
VLFHAVPRRGASPEWVESLTGSSCPGWRSLFGLCRGGDLCGLYSALSLDGKLVVENIPLMVWGLCFGKVVGVMSCLFGPVQGYRRMGPRCPPTPPVSASSIYAAVVCVRELGSVCYILSIYPVLSGVLCEFKYALSNSFFLSLSIY